MGQERLRNTENINKKGSFLRPLVDKIRNIDGKWILGGTFLGAMALGVGIMIADYSPVLAVTAFGTSLTAGWLLYREIYNFGIAPRSK